MSKWRERLNDYDDEHRHMLEGGSISQLFLSYSLSFSHPVFVGIVYAIMINLCFARPSNVTCKLSIFIALCLPIDYNVIMILKIT